MRRPIPKGLKWVFTAWIAIWVPLYWHAYGPINFLWMCDMANLILLIAIWRENRLWISAQAVGVFLIQCVWTLDVLCRWLFGFHLVGGTEYMFDPAISIFLRALSFFHLIMPFLFFWLLGNFGYHPRGWIVQSLYCAVLLTASYGLGGPELNLNWVFAPFGLQQTWISPFGYLIFCFFAYPMLIFFPTHRLFIWIFGSIGDRRVARSPKRNPAT
ncbi:MAG: membrane-associated protein [Acidobacteria bacterium]|nr:membrane-associated protein [Acidobacteriota bacterium]